MFAGIILAIIAIILIVYICISKSSSNNRSENHDSLISRRKYGAELKGQIGEEYVIGIINHFKYPNEYLINDIIIPSLNDKTSQIDHVFINKDGIWIIETKNYSGKIYGMQNSENWTEIVEHNIVRYRRGFPRIIGKRHRKYSFRNPIKQNATHIYSFKQAFNLKGVAINGLVVFNNADISCVSAQNVCNVDKIMKYLHTDSEAKLTDEQIKSYYDMILAYKQNNKVDLNVHIDNIYKTQKEIDSGICPRCGNQLKVRTGKYGKFLGCSSYPICKFKKKIE